MEMNAEFTTNHLGMEQATLLSKQPNSRWSIIKPHAFTAGYYEVALIIAGEVQEPERFDSLDDVIKYITEQDKYLHPELMGLA